MNRQALNLKEEAAKLESQLESSCNDLKMSEECHLLGRFLEIVKKDNAKAAAVYKSNCQDGQNGSSCFNLAQLYHTEMVDHREAYNYNRKGCDLGNAKCCFGAAMANFSDDLNKGGVGKNPSLAIENLKRSCQLGSGTACFVLFHYSIFGIPGVVEKDLLAASKLSFETTRRVDFTEDETKLDAIWDKL